MRIDKTTIRILVRNDYGKCFDFYTEKLGLIAVWGDRNTSYTSFATSVDAPACLAMFDGNAMSMFKGYEQPIGTIQPDTIVAVIPSEDLDIDYLRLKEAGVQFLGEPQTIEAWGMRCTYFRDPEGNLFELNDDASV